MRPVREKIIRYTIVVLLGTLLFPLSAVTAVHMETYIGFSGMFKLNSWAPISVILENRGGSLNGTLQVVATSGTEYLRNLHDTVYTQDISLPANTKKRFAFTVHLDSFSRPVTISLMADQRVLAEESISLRTRYTTLPLVIGTGSKLAPDALSNFPPNVHPLTVRPPFLPETRFGYDGVSLLVLDAAVLADLNQRQFQALNRWLRAGGFMVVAGRMNFGFFATAGAQKLFGLQITGFEQLSQIKALENFCGYPLTARSPFLVLKAQVSPAETLVSENGIPLVVRKSRGWGQLLFLAFDHRAPPFRNWAGQTAFWNKIMALTPLSPPAPPGLSSHAIIAALTDTVGFKFPSFFLILLFVVTYVMLGHLTLKRAEQGLLNLRTAMKRLTLVVCLFTAGGGFLYLFEHLKSTLRYNGFLQLSLNHSSGVANGTYTLGIYALKQQWVQFNLGRDFHPIRPLMLAADGPKPWKGPGNERFPHDRIELHETGSALVVRTAFEDWSQKFFRMPAQVQLPLRGGADFDGNSLVININNPSPHTFIDCQLYFHGRVFEVGNIPADGRRRIEIATTVFENDRTKGNRYNGDGQPLDHLPLPRNLYKSVKSGFADQLEEDIRRRFKDDPNHLCIYGWLASSVYPVHVNERLLPGNHLAFIEWRIPVS